MLTWAFLILSLSLRSALHSSGYSRRFCLQKMFLFQNDDAFLVLENAVKEINRILRASGKGPLHRTWVDLPYGEEEICLLEDELLPIAQMVLDRIEEIDLKIQVEQERKWVEEYVDVEDPAFA